MFKFRKSTTLTGLVPGEHGTAIARVERHGKDQVRLHSCDVAVAADPEADRERSRNYYADHGEDVKTALRIGRR